VRPLSSRSADCAPRTCKEACAGDSPCSHLAHDGTTPGDTGRHQTTRDDTWSRDPCLDAATLGSGARKGVGVRLSPLAPPLTCGSSLRHLLRTTAKNPFLLTLAHACSQNELTPPGSILLSTWPTAPPRCSMMMTFGGLRAPWRAFARILIFPPTQKFKTPWQLKQSPHALGS
jgi:hypothetical protein